MSVLRVTDVRKTFEEGSQRVEVLKGVTLEVAPAEVVALEGPSGSGKTTLLSIMGCILTPSSGEVYVAGERVERALTRLDADVTLVDDESFHPDAGPCGASSRSTCGWRW